MKLKPRTLLPLLGLALASLTASAQHEEYITQADATIAITFGTHIVKPVDSSGYITTTPITSRLGNTDILTQLSNDGVITGGISGWRLVAVKAAPADVAYINGGFQLYVIKENTNPALTQRIPYPGGTFVTTPSFFSVKNYVERHQGANVISSRGTVTSYTTLDFTPKFTSEPVIAPPITSGGSRVSTKTYSDYILNALRTAGYASIRYETKTTEPVFYCAISGMTYAAVGDFSGSESTFVVTTTTALASGSTPVVSPPVPLGDDPNIPNSGLVTIRVTLTGAKLVRQSDYPAVPYF